MCQLPKPECIYKDKRKQKELQQRGMFKIML